MSRTTPRLRFRLRTLMLVVIVVAVAMASVALMVKRSRRFERLAGEHARAAQDAADTAWGYNRFGRRPGDGNDPIAARYWAVYAHHKKLAAKYQQASARPWWPIVVDPPEPATE